MKSTLHNGQYSDSNMDWGGLPVVLLLGDDCQLPSIGAGAWRSIQPFTEQDVTSHRAKGFELLKSAAMNHMELTTVKRQDVSEQKFQRILNNLRNTGVSNEDALYLHT